MITDDFIYVQQCDKVIDGFGKAAFFTKEHMYVISDWQEKDRGFWVEMLSDNTAYQAQTFDGKLTSQVIAEMCQTKGASKESVEDIIQKLNPKAVTSYALEDIEKFKVFKGFLGSGGSISAKMKGKKLYTPVLISIPKPYNKAVKEFYAELSDN